MSIRSNTPHIRHLLAAALLLPLLTACSFMSEDYYDCDKEPPTTTSPEKYINLSIVVSAGNENTTRADEKPAGGEDGDGREAGSERENKVTGITLMLYQDQDGKGINTADDNTKIDFIRYFPVTEDIKREDADTGNPKEKKDEVVYTTGDQSIGSSLDFTTTYHVIVVANQNLENKYTVGSRVTKIREDVTSSIYKGTGIGVDATEFVMALEEDCEIDFKGIKPKSEGNKLIYTVTNPIRIERLAARIDFWMKGAKYRTKENDPAYEKMPGYEYNVTKSDGTLSNDKFVLTAVTPFNLYDESEFYIKHVNPSKDGKVQYLDPETTTSYVIDPKTDKKEVVSLSVGLQYKNPLSELVKASTAEDMAIAAGGWRRTTEKLREGTSLFVTFDDNVDNEDNFILCYPKENTLKLSSPLYYYATGVAIEGYYYKDGQGTGEYRVYYGFLRHQGEGSSGTYDINTKEDFEDNENAPVGDKDTPMNFSVVRNNIYRIYIHKITEQGEIELKIIVKEWDKFTHDMIYM